MAKLQVKANDLKQAIAAVQALTKGMPGAGVGTGDAKCAILRSCDGFSIVSSTDRTTAEVVLPTMSFVAPPAPGDLDEWNGKSDMTASMLVGFANADDVASLMTKLGTADLAVEVARDNHRLVIRCGRSENQFDIVDPRLIPSRFTRFDGGNAKHAYTLSSDQLEWFAATVGELGAMIAPSVSHPGFGSVVFNAYPSKSRPLTISGNSDADGYSVIYTTIIASELDFEMLVPKPLASGFNAFVKALGKTDGDTSFEVVVDNRRVKTLILRNGGYMISVACSADAFPFTATDNILKMAASPAVSARVKYKEINGMLGRTGVSAGAGSITTLEITDGGMLSLVQHDALTTSNVLARDAIELDGLVKFPGQSTEVSTIVRTDVLRKAVATMKQADAFSVSITAENRPGANGKLILEHDYNIAVETAVLMGIRKR